MRVLQLIDSLNPGGAEKMAVNIANGLVQEIDKSFLCCTRQEGLLKNNLNSEVGYIFLSKRHTLDLRALKLLKKFVRANKIDLLHVHSTSYFLAVLLKWSENDLKLVWHDHYGESEFLAKREIQPLKFFSAWFNGIISVNPFLKIWAENALKAKNVVYLRNFITEDVADTSSEAGLKGGDNDFKIVCVANLRPQKDHLNLLEAFEALDLGGSVSLHLIGEDPISEYSATILERVRNSRAGNIYFYGVQHNVPHFLKQAHLGILPSRSEGLPVALLEYGNAGLPVICTKVGQCPEVVGENGWLIEKENSEELKKAIIEVFQDLEGARQKGKLFQAVVQNKFLISQNIHFFTGFYSRIY